jgi:hypothetical protein
MAAKWGVSEKLLVSGLAPAVCGRERRLQPYEVDKKGFAVVKWRTE